MKSFSLSHSEPGLSNHLTILSREHSTYWALAPRGQLESDLIRVPLRCCVRHYPSLPPSRCRCRCYLARPPRGPLVPCPVGAPAAPGCTGARRSAGVVPPAAAPPSCRPPSAGARQLAACGAPRRARPSYPFAPVQRRSLTACPSRHCGPSRRGTRRRRRATSVRRCSSNPVLLPYAEVVMWADEGGGEHSGVGGGGWL